MPLVSPEFCYVVISWIIPALLVFQRYNHLHEWGRMIFMADIQGWALIARVPWLPDQTSYHFLTELGERMVLKRKIRKKKIRYSGRSVFWLSDEDKCAWGLGGQLLLPHWLDRAPRRVHAADSWTNEVNLLLQPTKPVVWRRCTRCYPSPRHN